ncbi:hypothetical protein Golob_025259 [Gossypium lobatum]|uniref:Uncharacterized protein n=1 Tax=Gossypium lobatum TaxID=34289 RepID=A0A7J8NDH8_9ROSI|nr:hypothetical protein [Gossypium lobatum]
MHRQRGTKAKAFSPFSSGEELDPKVVKFCFQQPGRMSQMISKMWVTATESSKNEVEAGKGFGSWSEEVDGGDGR